MCVRARVNVGVKARASVAKVILCVLARASGGFRAKVCACVWG